MARKIVITGATGTIGSKLLDELAVDERAGQIELWASVRSAPKASAAFRRAVSSACGSTMRHAIPSVPPLRATHALFLLRPYGMEAFIQSKQLIDVAHQAGVTHIVHVSAHGAPWAATIGWIHLIDAYIAQSGISYTLLRPAFFMDNLLAVTNPEARTVTHFFGTGPVGWIAAVDIARVAAAVIRHPGEHAGRTYPLATESRSMTDVAALLRDVTGEPYQFVPAAADERAVAALVARGRGEYFSRMFIEYMRAIAAGEVSEAAQTFQNVSLITGRPATTWREFIETRAESFRQHTPA